jgi:hypothetical protein
MPSPDARTSSVTVFIVPPPNIALKIGDQLLGSGESVVAFLAAEMPMLAFAGLIVEPQNTLAVCGIRKPILECVSRSSKVFRLA